MILAAASTCLKMDLAVSCSTLARSPCEIATSPILRQRLHRFADGGAADAEALHQFALRWHVVARLQLADW